jgi:hypothetical protein
LRSSSVLTLNWSAIPPSVSPLRTR